MTLSRLLHIVTTTTILTTLFSTTPSILKTPKINAQPPPEPPEFDFDPHEPRERGFATSSPVTAHAPHPTWYHDITNVSYPSSDFPEPEIDESLRRKRAMEERRRALAGVRTKARVAELGRPSPATVDVRRPCFQPRTLLEFEDFVVCYDNVTKTACWTLEKVRKEGAESGVRSFPGDQNDRKIPKEFRTDERDYSRFRSEFKRQYLASHVRDSRVNTNVVPQVVDIGHPNARTLWDELNDRVVELAKCSKQVYVLSGPLYVPHLKPNGRWFVRIQQLGAKKIAAPTHFFKAILAVNFDNSSVLECYQFENKLHHNLNLEDHLVDRQDLESHAGFFIFEHADE